MYEILLLAGVFLTLGLAKHRRSNRWGPNMLRVRINNAAAVGALANNDLAIGALIVAADGEYRALSIKGTWSMSGHTAGEGPIHFGISHGDYTSAEVEEWFESTGAMSQGDKVANEQASRLCRQVGTFQGLSAEEVINDGKPVTTKMNWRIAEGVTLNTWIYNQSGATLMTGTVVQTAGHIVGRWI